ncbi:MAG TPA: neuraminidase-like domain-containing protein, partial [Bacteroidia bacterium]|nr:neuraminidase-like domain-containing protein [Bacteroidia bacterium]
DKENKIIGNVDLSGKAITPDGKPFVDTYSKGQTIRIMDPSQKMYLGWINANGIYGAQEQRIGWTGGEDTCDITKVRLKHLDGTDLTSDEYDKIHRFIRLWHKMGWSIDETDKAICGLSGQSAVVPGTTNPAPKDCFADFKDDCNCQKSTGSCNCDTCCEDALIPDINADLIHQLVAVKRLLDSTGLELIKLLTFWGSISIRGEKSLYARLFLTANMLGVDTVFKADANGNYLSNSAEKLTDHLPVLMAAFHLKAADITNIISLCGLPDQLSLKTISTIYRYRLLMTILSIKSEDLPFIISLFGDPFTNADISWAFLMLWGRMEDAGFTYAQLSYVINGQDNSKKPLAPRKKDILQLSKTIYDGINGIDITNADMQSDADATSEMVRTKVSLIFEQSVVEQIAGLLEGTTIYSTNAPVNLVTKQSDFTSKLSDTLNAKLKYNFTAGAIQVTGILTTAEIAAAKALFSDPEWSKAFDRISKQVSSFYRDVLYAIFPAPPSGQPDTAKQTLLQGDVIVPGNTQDPANTAPIKRAFFMKAFLPFLREGLIHKFLTSTLAGLTSMDIEATDVLLSQILLDKASSKPIIEIFKSIKTQAPQGTTGWKGYLCPATEGLYTFAVTSDTQPDPIQLDGKSMVLSQQDDPSNVWLSEPIQLKSGLLYALEVTGIPSDLSALSWKTPKTPKTTIPSSALIPDYATQSVEQAFTQLVKASILVNGFSLKANEIAYLSQHSSDFDALDFNAFKLIHWQRLEAYTRLRKSLPATDTDLISFFSWASQTTDPSQLSQYIASLTLWQQTDIDKLIGPTHFNLNNTGSFRNEINLLKLQQALLVAAKMSMDINILFDWAKPSSKFWICHDIAENIRKTTKAKYKEEDWEKVIQPLNDKLRNNQRDALIAYLLVQPDLINWGIEDADSLFEFFLIDVQMDACMQTSRLKQAICSVQLFVQRCFLGLEEPYGVPTGSLDRSRWEWMQREVLWEANRKVFLYPENWIMEELRDDKSDFYKELESHLLQKDINTQTISDALKNYLYNVDEVANMLVAGIFIDDPGQKIHVFSRTRNAPFFFYYRYYKTDEQTWFPWSKIQTDIPSYDVVGSDNKVTANGCYLTPVVFNNRLLIFFPQLVKKTKPSSAANGTKIADIGNGKTPGDIQAEEYWEIKLAWSELRNGKWTPKIVSKDATYSVQSTDTVDNYKFIPLLFDDHVLICVDDSVDNDAYMLAAYQFEGSKLFKVTSSLPAFPGTINPSSQTFSFQRVLISGAYNLRTWQVNSGAWKNTDYLTHETESSISENIDGTAIVFDDPYTHQLLGKVETDDLSDLFGFNLNIPDSEKGQAFGMGDSGVYNELKRPYSLYNWELFFHAPVTLADKLSKSQQ